MQTIDNMETVENIRVLAEYAKLTSKMNNSTFYKELDLMAAPTFYGIKIHHSNKEDRILLGLKNELIFDLYDLCGYSYVLIPYESTNISNNELIHMETKMLKIEKKLAKICKTNKKQKVFKHK